MTDFKTAIWMAGWDEQDFQEYAEAWDAATSISDDSGERSREWLRLVLDAEQAQREWASDVLADMQRRGALSSWKDAPVTPVVVRKGRSLRATAGAKRRDEGGTRDIWVQTELFDMARDELLQQTKSNHDQALTFQAKSALAKRLVELIDAAVSDGMPADGATARKAAAFMKVDLVEWCAA